MHQGGDGVVFDFSIRARHAARADDVEDASRWWTRPQERAVRLENIAIPRRSLTQNALYDCQHMVLIAGTVCPSTGRPAASTGWGSPSILPRGRYGGN